MVDSSANTVLFPIFITSLHECTLDPTASGKVGRSETVAVDLSGPDNAESAQHDSSPKRRHSLTLGDIDKPQEQT